MDHSNQILGHFAGIDQIPKFWSKSLLYKNNHKSRIEYETKIFIKVLLAIKKKKKLAIKVI